MTACSVLIEDCNRTFLFASRLSEFPVLSAYWENRVLNLDCRVLSNSFCIQLAIENKYYSKSKTNIVLMILELHFEAERKMYCFVTLKFQLEVTAQKMHFCL